MVRPRSLFWTFAGAFLLVVVAAAALQTAVGLAVLRPLAAQQSRERAETTIDRVARELSTLPETALVPDVVELLHAHMMRERDELLVFAVRNGRVLHDRRVPPEVHHDVVAVLDTRGLANRLADERAGPPGGGPRGGPPGFDEPPDVGRPGDAPRWRSDGPPAAFEEVPLETDVVEPPRPTPPRRDGAANAGDAAARLALLAHRTVSRDGRVLGELAVLGPASASGLAALPETRGVLFILPIAVLVSAAAGLVLVRLLVRRLTALERVTDRIAGGDIAPVANGSGRDEIGRLEDRFSRMADRVVAARERLEETDRQRRRLLADITHELATPLTSIRGYVETLLDPHVTTTTEERTAYLHDVLDESRRLEAMIDELFDLARLEAGATKLTPVRLDWSELCRNTARRLEPRLRAAGIAFVWAGPDAPAWVAADGRRLEEVAENLLTNAIRYVPEGGTVTLSMARATTPSGERLRFTVEDDGPGIAEQDLPHLFERFYRADAMRTTGGTGLGLAIVKEIVRLHGGEVSARRREPRGAAFIVDLPPA